jgi:hypothetical protein
LGVLARASSKEDSMKVAMIMVVINAFLFVDLAAVELLHTQESNPQVEKCLQEVLTSDLIKHKFPDLLSNKYDSSGYEFLKQVDQYCICHAKNLTFEHELKKRDHIAFEFRDKSKRHSIMDQCSLKNFSKYNLGVFFETMVSTRVRHTIENKLEGRMIAGTKQMASEFSVRNRLLCLESKILQQCTKIQSLHSTFKCVSKFISNADRMDNIGRTCPKFKTFGEEENFQAFGEVI